MTVSRRKMGLLLLAASVTLLSGCSETFETAFKGPLDPGVTRGWRVTDVQVSVPASLTVSEAKSLLPRADIVWREDPPGDRHAQVATIIRDAAKQGASGLRGSRPVVLSITVSRFHALTFEAETRLQRSGVHNIHFTAQVSDARSGAILAGPEVIEASLPAFSGEEAKAARAKGLTQKKVIHAHVAATIAAWLGVGPDNRSSFSRMGG